MTEELINYMKKLQYKYFGSGNSEFISFEEMMQDICDNYVDEATYNIFMNTYNNERYIGITELIMPTFRIIILSDVLDDSIIIDELKIEINLDMTDYIKQYRRCLNISKL